MGFTITLLSGQSKATLARTRPAASGAGETGSLRARGAPRQPRSHPSLPQVGSLQPRAGPFSRTRSFCTVLGGTYQLHKGSLHCNMPYAGRGQLWLTWHRRGSQVLGRQLRITPRSACAGSGPQCPAPRRRQHHPGRAAEAGWAPGGWFQLPQAALQLLLLPRAPGDRESGSPAGR